MSRKVQQKNVFKEAKKARKSVAKTDGPKIASPRKQKNHKQNAKITTLIHPSLHPSLRDQSPRRRQTCTTLYVTKNTLDSDIAATLRVFPSDESTRSFNCVSANTGKTVLVVRNQLEAALTKIHNISRYSESNAQMIELLFTNKFAYIIGEPPEFTVGNLEMIVSRNTRICTIGYHGAISRLLPLLTGGLMYKSSPQVSDSVSGLTNGLTNGSVNDLNNTLTEHYIDNASLADALRIAISGKQRAVLYSGLVPDELESAVNYVNSRIASRVDIVANEYGSMVMEDGNVIEDPLQLLPLQPPQGTNNVSNNSTDLSDKSRSLDAPEHHPWNFLRLLGLRKQTN